MFFCDMYLCESVFINSFVVFVLMLKIMKFVCGEIKKWSLIFFLKGMLCLWVVLKLDLVRSLSG